MNRNSSVTLFFVSIAAHILLGGGYLFAHPGHSHDDHHHDVAYVQAEEETDDQAELTEANPANNRKPVPLSGPSLAAFAPFVKTVSARVIDQHLVIESNGLPEHNMMVGIRSWQQQVPLPQPFTGANAWRLPMKPQPAQQPISVLTEPLRGAIAIAVNGVPIFPALNNRGDDTYLAGELDEWGGHCGRGDDYHYHIAPVHLEESVGDGNPIGFALDGYPILGFTDPDGTTPTDLDEFNGHKDANGNYHYHATTGFPYINGGLRGVVVMDGDQIKQPKDSPIRPAQSPLKGATVTGFSRTGDQFELQYQVAGKESRIQYAVLPDDRVEFTHITPTGDATTTTIYHRGQAGNSFVSTISIIATLLVLSLLTAGIFIRLRRT